MKITLIGSGINSFFITKKLISVGIKPTIINDSINSYDKQSKFDFNKKVSPKINLNNFNNNIIAFKEKYHLKYLNFDNQSGLSLGGLSNIWGGLLYEFNQQEYSENKINKQQMDLYFNNFKNHFNIEKQNSKSAFYAKLKLSKKIFTKNNYIFYDNENNIFNAKNFFKEFIEKKHVNYIDGFATNIKKINNKYRIMLELNGRNEIYDTDILILSAGAIGSSILLMKYLNKNNVKLLCTPMYSNIYLNYESINFKDLEPIFSFNSKYYPQFQSSIFPLSNLPDEYFPLSSITKYFFKYLKNHLFGAYHYLDSSFSDIIITKVDKNFIIKSGLNNNLNLFKSYDKHIKKSLFNKNIFKFPFTTQFFYQGSDNHVGGSFPKNIFFNDDLELLDNPNFFVSDSTHLIKIPPLGYTLTTILNSLKIADIIIKKIKT